MVSYIPGGKPENVDVNILATFPVEQTICVPTPSSAPFPKGWPGLSSSHLLHGWLLCSVHGHWWATIQVHIHPFSNTDTNARSSFFLRPFPSITKGKKQLFCRCSEVYLPLCGDREACRSGRWCGPC